MTETLVAPLTQGQIGLTPDATIKEGVPSCPFTVEAAAAASKWWGFNCGPAALCAVLGMTPAALRPHLGNFETKGYMNPSMMAETLKRLGIKFDTVFKHHEPGHGQPTLINGLVRIQWGGPWTKPGVPMRARYTQTHWIGMRGDQIFDASALAVGGWISARAWAEEFVPWLNEDLQWWDGTFWPTHGFEVL